MPRPQGKGRQLFSVALLHLCPWVVTAPPCVNTELSLPRSLLFADLSMICPQTQRDIWSTWVCLPVEFQNIPSKRGLEKVGGEGAPGLSQSPSSTPFFIRRCLRPFKVWNKFTALRDTGSRNADPAASQAALEVVSALLANGSTSSLGAQALVGKEVSCSTSASSSAPSVTW